MNEPVPRRVPDVQTELSRAALDSAPYAMFVCNDDGMLERMNAAFTRLTGHQPADLLGKRSFLSLLDPSELARRRPPALASLSAGEAVPYDDEWHLLTPARSWLPVRLALSCVEHVPGERRWVGIVLDLSQHVEVASRLWYVTHHDPVTRLPNQTLLDERLELAIHRCARQQAGLTVMLIELDHLRKLRGTFGPPAAELALRIAAERLREAVGPEDTLACLGGSQFVIVTNETGDAARVLASKLQARLAQWVDVDRNTVALDASIGAVSYPDHGSTPETLLRRAHVALAIADANGGGLRFFSSEMDAQAKRRNALESLLRVAVHDQPHAQLHLVYQPQVSLSDGEIRNAETLLRWRHPSLGAIGPAEFIPIAETSGMILALGEWVMQTACREASRLLRRCGRLPRISVNVSAQQFARQDVVGMVERALQAHALAPAYLEIEITETVLLGDSSTAVGCLRSLHDMGVEIAVDDFGTGYASLAYLTRFPVNRLKIDRTFVRDMLTHAPSHAIVSAVIAMAHSLGLRVTAEGVETQAQAQRLTELGCDEAQGYWFARPVDMHGLHHIVAPLGSGARR
ncbi:putative bifunctional diguanylate cyclase/phosphodiesterase [Pandoraea pulmonicola]|uniref:Bacteriophytochrome cph2 n=1 Tax=Pandoraea pulmonicola TaxID=93221 RepID=A0AAJ4ZEF0_PANPU|nr:EAL domain-containing protein [Pandoraea pulmonicola]AJC23062.2 diguanylate phosphodiesterase [Pandoraea pulmonicola]SUA91860.1 Bacteriophytochrome cph2 [Pandoraea pulmonicola]